MSQLCYFNPMLGPRFSLFLQLNLHGSVLRWMWLAPGQGLVKLDAI